MRFIHTADWHIGRAIAAQRYGAEFARKRRQELLSTAENIVRYANDNQVELLLCAGDLFHNGHIRMEELHQLNAILSQLKTAKFVVTPGNHDPLLPNYNNYQRINWCPQVIVAKEGCSEIELEELDCCIHCYGWSQLEQSLPLPEHWQPQKKARWDILMLHGDAMTAPTRYLPLSLSWLKSLKMDYIALGHIHQAVVLEEHIRYSGSPEPHTISETGDHGFWLCDLTEQGLTVQKILTAQRKCIPMALEINPEDAFWQIRSRIRNLAQQQGKQHLYDIELVGQHSAEHPVDGELLRQELLSDGVLCQIEDNSLPDYDLQRLMQENENNLLGGFIRSFQGRALNPQEQLALELGIEALLQEMRGHDEN